MASVGSWNGPEPIRGFPRHLCGLPIPSTRHRDRSQEIAPGAGRLENCKYIRHSSGEGRPALVEHACQNHVVAQTNAKAPGWALSQINIEMLVFHTFLVLKELGWSKSEMVTESDVLVFILSLHSRRRRRRWTK